MKSNATKKVLTLTISILVGLMILGLMPVHGEAEIYDSVLRLHVLANSDSPEDQALKLLVRDGVLAEASEIVGGCTTRDEAEGALSAALDRIEAKARAVLAENGSDYEVTVAFGPENYPTRSYENICFPSGTYMSLRVCIGEANGKNWWCVLFPNLCLSAAKKKDAEDAFVAAGLTPEQYRIITESGNGKYKVRFKILELLDGIFGNKQK